MRLKLFYLLYVLTAASYVYAQASQGQSICIAWYIIAHVPALDFASLLGDTLTGQTITLDSFSLTAVANASHAIFSFKIDQPTGWVAIGTGQTYVSDLHESSS